MAILKAPRIEIHSLENLENEFDPAKLKLKKELPELKTLTKVFYEKSISKQKTIDFSTIFANCLEKRIDSLKKSLNKTTFDSGSEKLLKNSANEYCQKIKESCEKNQNEVKCQRAFVDYK